MAGGYDMYICPVRSLPAGLGAPHIVPRRAPSFWRRRPFRASMFPDALDPRSLVAAAIDPDQIAAFARKIKWIEDSRQ